jgi:Zn-dependent protease with chaperone function
MPDDDAKGDDRRRRWRRADRTAPAVGDDRGTVASAPSAPETKASSLWVPERPSRAQRQSLSGLRVSRAVEPDTFRPPDDDTLPPDGHVADTEPTTATASQSRRVAPADDGSAPAPGVSANGVDGIPAVYDDGAEWLRNGVKRHPWAVTAALLFGWTGVWLALWGAALGAIVGIFVALGVVDTTSLGSEVTQLGGGQAVTIVSILGGIFFGAIGGFLEVLRYILAETPWEAVVALATGAVLATAITVTMATFERLGLRIRGYRRLSRDEVRRVAPLVRDIAEATDLDGLPRFAIDDSVIPNAWSHMRTIVITTVLLQTLDDAELRAVLTHELRHWQSGDAVGLHVVWAAAWPIAITYNIGMLIAGKRQGMGVGAPSNAKGLLVLIGWVIAWPAWVVLTLVIAPATAATQRRYEYDADAAAARLGYAAAMISALRKMGAFEGGRTGWEQAMNATHPPTELRIEALQAPKPDDAQYQEDDLHGPGWAEVKRVAGGLLRPRRPRA